MFEWEIMLMRLIIAATLCGFIGLEREVKRHPAGFRTHLLVGVGACLMMLLSLYGFDEYIENNEHIQFDPARIPSYVISGIGFLGAGTILVKGVTVRGLTTAASIWVVAGLGLVIGAGMFLLAFFTTAIVLLSLIFLNKFEPFIYNKGNKRRIKAILKENELEQIIQELEKLKCTICKMYLSNTRFSKEKTTLYYYVFEIKIPKRKKDVIFEQISKIKGVQKVF
ncbi:MgtC/SapB family protein [Bacillus alveayuensis]|jgi:putative Mg2+ transporter-C (MgtC) family protein|nr:MgtC/SapB family protein [Bacillus alveayuensis]